MKRRFLLILAVSVYLVVVGCVVWPSGQAATRPGGIDSLAGSGGSRVRLDALPLRGAALQIQDVNYLEGYKKALDEIAATGFDTVEIVVVAHQENALSERVFLDLRTTPSPDMLNELFSYAKQKKLRVMFMPIVLLENPDGNDWRGTIRPPSWSSWFGSYREMIHLFATIAEKNHVDIFVVGSELVSSELKDVEWANTIKQVRADFHGLLTYSSNWDHYTVVSFWDKLDFIGMNSYWKLGENPHEHAGKTASVEEIQSRWRAIQKDLISFSNKKKMPIVFTEVGWCSLANAAHEPWDYTKVEEGLDLDLQRKLYEGFFRSWYGNENLGGFMIWEWLPYRVAPDDKSYSPHNKPAEKVLKEWLAKGPWQVK
jgi:hypothetical protein